MPRLRICALALSLLLPAPIAAAADADPVVAAPAGSVRGVVEHDIRIFRGIPYAQAPVGERRWRPPAALADWDGVRDASKFGAACMQPKPRAGNIYAGDLPAMSEDCLSLNVWAPENAKNAPVFVWIHGGSLMAGSGAEPLYDGSALARRGIVVVTINYRLGMFGYFAHPALSAEAPDHVSGNYGLLDQIAALQWVKRNIGAFGGNAANVTVAGESAGALSVMYLMTAPAARGLFAKAVAQSAYMVSAPALRDRVNGMVPAEEQGSDLAAKLGATDLAALRALPAETIADKVPTTGYFPFPAIDGKTVPRQLVDSFDRGEQAPVPILAGFNSGEIRSLRFLLPKPPADAAAYEAAVRAGYGEFADMFLARYPAKTIDESMLAATRDAMYGWTAERLVSDQAAAGKGAYFYLFDHGYPATQEWNLHAFHASELPYVFGTASRTPPLWPKIPDTLAERKLSEAMGDYWASFAATGKPQAKGWPDWPDYADDRGFLHFADTPRAGHNLFPGTAALHEAVVCRRRAAGDIAWNWNVGIIAPPLPPKAEGCQ
ncbi:carboxylesterase/lipase family protein [Sphingopyxis terrae]|uniref:Carboxylic ester hydrolase n=1 Tax=Sphingopyxis terrae subsp. ummariensis TaxID=429001 RepID=A0A1Y6ETS9_9SPHN|nr:carboxylesterase family protein [Sphingopyxis terrae]PCF92519.1 carboxylesterase [Sphingopyxis terrae subsp. ummariensis]SMQ64641.1 para-nitrobenzyl esterase [Sphingopyxis terrae subsp. ummariensis]